MIVQKAGVRVLGWAGRMSGFSIDPLLLPSCTEAAWFQSPDLDEDAHLTFWEKLHEQQACPP